MIEAKVMSEAAPIEKLKLMLVGKEKNGKSRLASTARKPILFHDHDNRAEALNGIPGVYVLSYVDPQWPKQPEASEEQLDVLGQLENNLDLSKLVLKGKRLFPTAPDKTIVRTNVIDSLATLSRNVMQYAMHNTPSLRREIAFGKTKVFLPSGWDTWNADMKGIEPVILRFLALPTDTVLIMHEIKEEAEESTDEKKIFTGKVSVYPARHAALIKYFNELWRVKLTPTVINNKSVIAPKVYPLPTYEFDAATTMLLDAVEDPNIEAMILKHEQKLRALGKMPSQIAAPQTKELPQSVKSSI